MTRLRGNAIGTFRVISGEISGDPADPAHTGKVRIVVDAGSYSSGSAIRDHTVVDSVLDAADFPEITFSSLAIDNVAMANSDEGSASIDGNLTLRGQTRPLTALVSVALPSPDRLEARGEMSFHYPDFGVPVPLGIFHLMRAGDDVIVKFLIVARRAPR